MGNYLFCQECVVKDLKIQAKQQMINRLRQACGTTENIHKAESEKAQIETELKKHKDEARESMLMYKSMTEKCKGQWNKMKGLEAKSCSADEQATLEDLKHGFTLVLSADYQMNKLLPYWGIVRDLDIPTTSKRYPMMCLG